jgi:hypothetical protein
MHRNTKLTAILLTDGRRLANAGNKASWIRRKTVQPIKEGTAVSENNTVVKQEPIEAEIIKRDAMPQSVNVSAKTLRKQMERDKDIRAVIDEYIKNNMVIGKDYGTIKIGGKESKPSLFKPGAEKFCGLFKIRPTFKKDVETVEMLGNKPGIIAYVCELVDGRGRVIGEGRGSSSVDPSGKDFDVNKAVKIAEKRAQIDAVLRAGGLSDFFTQDMEDAPRSTNDSQPSMEGPASDKQRALISKKLDEIGVLPDDQKGYLIEQFGVEIPLTKEGASFVIGEMLGNNHG